IPDATAHREEQKRLGEAFAAFQQDNRAYQQDEERRLAYVAVTRARVSLLLSGSAWSGQTKPREPSTFLDEILDELGRDQLEGVDPADPGENPYAGEKATRDWPFGPLGARRSRVESAARLVRDA